MTSRHRTIKNLIKILNLSKKSHENCNKSLAVFHPDLMTMWGGNLKFRGDGRLASSAIVLRSESQTCGKTKIKFIGLTTVKISLYRDVVPLVACGAEIKSAHGVTSSSQIFVPQTPYHVLHFSKIKQFPDIKYLISIFS